MSNKYIKFLSDYSYLVYKRTYARRLNSDDIHSKTEEWGNTIDRCINSLRTDLKLNLSLEDEYCLRYNISNFKASLAGRFLWQLGTKTILDNGFLSLMNCSYFQIDNIKQFGRIFNNLMLGCGVGFSVENKYIKNLPPILNKDIKIIHDNNDNNYYVEDSREGWVELLNKVINSYFVNGESFKYNTSKIRKEGDILKSFGGVSTGDKYLIEMINNLNDILNKNKGLKLRDIDVCDMICTISQCVVAGNVRRAALISISDATSYNYLNAKRWSNGDIPNYRAFMNMTVVCDDFKDIINNSEFWHNYQDGEPFGFFNRKLTVSCGRIGETQYKEKSFDVGLNPCGEMNLEDGEVCNLAEIVLSRYESYNELLMIAKILYKACKHAYLLQTKDKGINEICNKNFRIGISITGYLETTEEQKQWLPILYKDLREYDILYTDLMNELYPEYKFNYSIKLTTIKPSGTLSSILNTTCYGIHPSFSKHMIRRVRISKNHELNNICKKAGYPVYPNIKFDGKEDETTNIIEFYIKSNDNAILQKDMTAIDQLEIIKRLQRDWSDNSVSCTVYYDLEELPKIKEYLLKNYNDNFKSLSFLMRYNHGFINAPLEEITEEEYNKKMKNIKPINLDLLKEIDDNDLYDNNDECKNGVCPIR